MFVLGQDLHPQVALGKTTRIWSGQTGGGLVDDVMGLGLGASWELNPRNALRLMAFQSFYAAPERRDSYDHTLMNRVFDYFSTELAYLHAFQPSFDRSFFIGAAVASYQEKQYYYDGHSRVILKKNGGYASFLVGYHFGKHLALEFQSGFPRYGASLSWRF